MVELQGMYKRFKRHARDAGGGAGPGPHEDRDGHGLDSLFEASSRDLGGPQREASSRGTEQGGLASAFPDSDETPGSEGASEPASDGSSSTWVVATGTEEEQSACRAGATGSAGSGPTAPPGEPTTAPSP